MAPSGDGDRRLAVGHICGVHGVQGWVKVYSYTQPPETIFTYRPWLVDLNGAWQCLEPAAGRRQGKHLIAKINGCDDRDQALLWQNVPIAIRRSQLSDDGSVYWCDVQGLRVINQDGVDFGVVDHLIATGANDVLVVRGERERLIPFVEPHYVTGIDRRQGVLRVSWHPDD